MARRKPPAEDDLPEIIDGLPIDQWLSLNCFFYGDMVPDRTPDAEFVRLLMRFHGKNHPVRKLRSREMAARVDFIAPREPSLRQAIAWAAKWGPTTQNAVRAAHRAHGRPSAELDRERKALRAKLAADTSMISKELLRRTLPKRPGRPKRTGPIKK